MGESRPALLAGAGSAAVWATGSARGSGSESWLREITCTPALNEVGSDAIGLAATTTRAHGANALHAFRKPRSKPASDRAVRLPHLRCGGLGGQLFKLRAQDSRQRGCRENIRESRKTEEGQEKSCEATELRLPGIGRASRAGWVFSSGPQRIIRKRSRSVAQRRRYCAWNAV